LFEFLDLSVLTSYGRETRKKETSAQFWRKGGKVNKKSDFLEVKNKTAFSLSL
jgi:hypothetical protein